jgi:hypothetical protein
MVGEITGFAIHGDLEENIAAPTIGHRVHLSPTGFD